MSLSKLLFGELALSKQLVTDEQVAECLDIQKKLKDMGITKTLGAVMHDKKYLTMVEIKEILREMTGSKDWNAIEGFKILSKLGKGGMGSVYKALHSRLNKLVALKVLPPELASDQEYLDRFWREARAAARLNHPNIVQALDVGESFGYHYFVMEYVDGATLKDAIDRQGQVDEAWALHVCAQINEALIHAEQAELVHRDIKPSNIIVNLRGVAKLCDLGLAKGVNEELSITQTGVIMGTPFYLSPEQARNEDLDHRSDIYSLGVTLYHMLTGQVPFTGNTAATILYKHIFMEPPKPRKLNPKLHPETETVLLKMLAKSPNDRQQDPSELYEELCDALRSVAPELIGSGGQLLPLPIDAAQVAKEESADTAAINATKSKPSYDTLGLVGEARPEDYGPIDDDPDGDRDEDDQDEGYDDSSGSVSGPVAAREDLDTLAGIGNISGPSPSLSGPQPTLTSGITAAVNLESLDYDPKQAPGRGRTRSVVLAACALACVSLFGLVYRDISALASAEPPIRPTNPGTMLSQQIAPKVHTALKEIQNHLKKNAFGEAAATTAALRSQPRLRAAEEARLLQATGAIADSAIAQFEKLNAAYEEQALAPSGEEEAAELLTRIMALKLPKVAAAADRRAEQLVGLAVTAAGEK